MAVLVSTERYPEENVEHLARAWPCMCGHAEHRPWMCAHRFDTGRCDCGGWRENLGRAREAVKRLAAT